MHREVLSSVDKLELQLQQRQNLSSSARAGKPDDRPAFVHRGAVNRWAIRGNDQPDLIGKSDMRRRPHGSIRGLHEKTQIPFLRVNQRARAQLGLQAPEGSGLPMGIPLFRESGYRGKNQCP